MGRRTPTRTQLSNTNTQPIDMLRGVLVQTALWMILLQVHFVTRSSWVNSFLIQVTTVPTPLPTMQSLSTLLLASSSSSDATTTTTASSTTVPTLSDATTWRLRIVLRNMVTELGTKLNNEMFVITGQFVEEDGYEPPQGTFVQQQQLYSSTSSSSSLVMQDEMNRTTITSATDITSSSSSSNRCLQIGKSRWILSEDPNDRKDGLWVWGLFKEPLYPYMLLSFETLPIPLNSTGTAAASTATIDCIPALQLYVQLNHTRNRDTGAVSFQLSNSASNYDLTIRQKETISADPLGVSKVDIYEELSIGTFSIQAI
jgi:hypothetical protein